MEDMVFLIISKFKDQPYFNRESLENLFKTDSDLSGYRVEAFVRVFYQLIEQELLYRHPSFPENYLLTEKGTDAYDKERLRRAERNKREEMEIKQIQSVVDTNESVKQTNPSVQAINKLFAENIPKQNVLTKTNIAVAFSSVVISFIVFIAGLNNTPNPAIVKQLEESNKLLKEELKSLNVVLMKQNAIDSILSKSRDSITNIKRR